VSALRRPSIILADDEARDKVAKAVLCIEVFGSALFKNG
jgi:hypothetical protein